MSIKKFLGGDYITREAENGMVALDILNEDDSFDLDIHCNRLGEYSINNNEVDIYIFDMNGYNQDCNSIITTATNFTIIESKVAVNGNYINVIIE